MCLGIFKNFDIKKILNKYQGALNLLHTEIILTYGCYICNFQFILAFFPILSYEKIQYESPKESYNFIDCMNKNIKALKVMEYMQNNLSEVALLNIILKKSNKETQVYFDNHLCRY